MKPKAWLVYYLFFFLMVSNCNAAGCSSMQKSDLKKRLSRYLKQYEITAIQPLVVNYNCYNSLVAQPNSRPWNDNVALVTNRLEQSLPAFDQQTNCHSWVYMDQVHITCYIQRSQMPY